MKSGDLGFSQSHRWTVQTPHGLPDYNPNGFSLKSDLNQLGVNICILLKMMFYLFDQSVRVISQLSGQPRERERERDKANIAAKNAESAVTESLLALASRLASLCKYPPQDISHFLPCDICPTKT